VRLTMAGACARAGGDVFVAAELTLE
jgi:hypothetical protein